MVRHHQPLTPSFCSAACFPPNLTAGWGKWQVEVLKNQTYEAAEA